MNRHTHRNMSLSLSSESAGQPSAGKLFSRQDLQMLIWPLMLEQLLSITLGMADIVMVGRLGEAAVSGVSLVDSIHNLLNNIFSALGAGGAVVCAQYIGSGKPEMASRTAKQLLYTITAVAVALLTLGLIFRGPLLSAVFGKIDSDVMAASQTYFLITLFGLPGVAVYSGCAALFRAQGNSRISMLTALLINILNIGGNSLLLFGLHRGVEGAAIPTFVSRTVAAIVLLVCLYRGREYNGKKSISIKGLFRHMQPDWILIKKILAIGVPNGLENSMFHIGKILVLSLIATYGTTAIAANAAGNTLASLEVLPAASINLAMLTVVGQCMGARQIEQAVSYTRKLIGIAYAGMYILNIPFLLLSYRILGLYGMSAETTRLAWYMTLTHGLCGLLIWPLSFTLPNALRAANDATYTMVVSMISMWGIRVGLSYVFKWTNIFGLGTALAFPPAYEALGVWFAMVLDWVLRSILFCGRFGGGKWKTRQLV
jgi:putative MATE family efflux protein